MCWGGRKNDQDASNVRPPNHHKQPKVNTDDVYQLSPDSGIWLEYFFAVGIETEFIPTASKTYWFASSRWSTIRIMPGNLPPLDRRVLV